MMSAMNFLAAAVPSNVPAAKSISDREVLKQVSDATHDALEHSVLGNSVHQWIVAGATLVILFLIVWVVRNVLAIKLERITRDTKAKWDDALVKSMRGIRLWLLFPAIVYAAANTLVLPEWLHKGLGIVAMLGVAVQLLITAGGVVDAVLAAILIRSHKKDVAAGGDPDIGPDPTLASSVGVLRVVVMAVLFVVVVLLGLDNLGFKVTPLLTGLGIGGIAVALAVQNILSDLFSSLTILLDKPFVVGDSIKIGEYNGTVERIGIKTTRLRSMTGEQLVIANSDLLSSRLQNFKRMQDRRAVFLLGIVYETSPEKIRRVPVIVREAIERMNAGTPLVRFDRCHFKGFGAYSLDFEAVYFMLTADYLKYMDAQQAINLAIFEAFAKEGIEFAYPTQVAIQRDGGGDASSAPTPARSLA